MGGMMAAMLGGSLLSAGGSVAGGLLGQTSYSSGDRVNVNSDTRNDLLMQASVFDAANQLGFGDINNVPSPFEQLVDRIQSLPLDEKIKRRGLLSLRDVFDGNEPQLPEYLDAILSRVGIGMSDLDALKERQVQFREQQAALGELSGINETTILNRARTAATASDLLAGAATAASGGQLSSVQQNIRDQLSRQVDRSEEQALLQGRLGGFNPAQALEGFADIRGGLDLRAIEQSLMLASGLTGGLNAGLGAAQSVAGTQSNASLGSLGIAANQAQAANQLQAETNMSNSTSLANGVSGAFGALGNAVTTSGILGAMSPAAGGNTGIPSETPDYAGASIAANGGSGFGYL